MDVAVDGGAQGDDHEIVGFGPPVLGFRVDRRHEEKEHEGGDEPADTGHGGERVEAAPALTRD